jgi:hypothetical protein
MAADVIRKLLRLLARANKDAAQVVKPLARILGHPAKAVELKNCEFSVGGKTYREKLTAEQGEKLARASRSPAAMANRLSELLGALNLALVACHAQAGEALKPEPTMAAVASKTNGPPPGPPPGLGCCHFVQDGQSVCRDNFTPTQCDAFHGKFTPGGTCATGC